MAITRFTRLAAPALRIHRAVRASSFATVHGNDPERLAKEKSRNLSGTQDTSAPHKNHAPGWNEKLASDAEANIKADQAGPPGKPDKSLQDATVKQTLEHHHTEKGIKGAEHIHAKKNPVQTGSEEAVKADRGDHH